MTMISATRTLYLDHQATTPVAPEVVDAMLPYFTERFANSSSGHLGGLAVHRDVERARGRVAALVGAGRTEISFTSGATEANNLALQGVVAARGGGGHVITTAVEHKSVLSCCLHLRTLGTDVTVLPVDRWGRVDPADVARAMRPDTFVVSVMAANNEVGVLQPIAGIAEVVRPSRALFHVDATQAVGHLALDAPALGIDLLTFSAHKIYGPKGIGALYVSREPGRRGLRPLCHGGDQEGALRPGTVNTPAVVGFGEAARLAAEHRDRDGAHGRRLRDRFLAVLGERTDHVLNSGQGPDHLPHAVSLAFPQVGSAAALLARLDHLALSTGSACNSASQEPSHVLTAMGLDERVVATSLRLSFGRGSLTDHAEQAARDIADAVAALAPAR